MEKAWIVAKVFVAALICAVAATHAALVFAVNMPRNPIKSSMEPMLQFYGGPQLQQGWGMFAPDPTESNLRVLVRGERADGSVTQWYSASAYLLASAPPGGVSPIREIDQTLAHAAFQAEATPGDQQSRDVVLRVATAVIRLYEHAPLARVQVQLEDHVIAPEPGSSRIRATRWLWQTAPDIGAF